MNPEAIEMLKAVKGPVSIVSLVGPYNTGKSSLASRALLDNPTAFETGQTTEPCTRVSKNLLNLISSVGLLDLCLAKY